jgi:hypothetical protein
MKSEMTTIEKAVKGQIEKHIRDSSKSAQIDDNAERMLKELDDRLLKKKQILNELIAKRDHI